MLLVLVALEQGLMRTASEPSCAGAVIASHLQTVAGPAMEHSVLQDLVEPASASSSMVSPTK